MKKVIRLTESDLVKIVKRVIKEGQSTPNVDLSSLKFSLKDERGQELFVNHKMYDSESILLNLRQTMFSPNEYVTLTINGGLVGTSVKMKTDSGEQNLNFTNGSFEKGPLTININMSKIRKDNNLGDVQIMINGNVDRGTLRLILNLNKSTVKPVSESYRRRKY